MFRLTGDKPSAQFGRLITFLRQISHAASVLSDTRVVVINGARQTGKSTLARLVMSEYPGSELRYLDEA